MGRSRTFGSLIFAAAVAALVVGCGGASECEPAGGADASTPCPTDAVVVGDAAIPDASVAPDRIGAPETSPADVAIADHSPGRDETGGGGADAVGDGGESADSVALPSLPHLPLANETREGRQWGTAVAPLADGGFLLGWMAVDPDNVDARAHVRFFGRDGYPRTGEIAVDADSETRQGFPAVAGLADGNAVVVWRAAVLGDPSTYRLDARILSPSGEFLTEVIRLSPDDLRNQNDLHLSTLTNGDLVLSWSWDRYDGSSTAVVARVLSPTLVPRGANFLPAEITDDTQARAHTVALPDGGFVATWDSTITAGYDVRARLFEASGAPRSPEISVNEYNTNGVQRHARVVPMASGELLFTYESNSSGQHVKFHLRDASGADVTWAGQVADELAWAGHPSVAAHPDGAVLFFQGKETNDDRLAIWRAVWNDGERTMGAVTRVSPPDEPDDPYPDHHAPEAVTLRDGEQVVVWTCGDGDREGVCFDLSRRVVQGPPSWDPARSGSRTRWT